MISNGNRHSSDLSIHLLPSQAGRSGGTSRRPLLLFICNRLEFFLSHRLPLALEANERGWRAVVSTPESEQASLLAQHNIGFIPIRFDRGGWNIRTEIRNFVSVWECIRRIRPDLVHVVTIKPVLYAGLACRALRAIPMVASVSGAGYVFTGAGVTRKALRAMAEFLYRRALAGAGKLAIFQNEDDLRLFVDRNLVDGIKSRVVRGSGVDGEQFRFTPETASKAPIVLFASRLLRDKGLFEFIEAARLLKSTGCEARFIIAGETDPANPSCVTSAEIQKFCQFGCVEWVGQVPDIRPLLCQSSIICLPSYREGLPKILIEAAAIGRAIVTTNVPGCREIVIDGVNGLLVPPRTVVPLASAIQNLLEEPFRRRQMARAGRDLFEKNFTLDRVISQTFDIYTELLRLGPGAEISDRRAAA